MTTLSLPDRELAYQQRSASDENKNKPGILFCGGYASDMNGSKASFFDQKAAEGGLAYLRFDYRGHGTSSGNIEDGCLSDWFDDACRIFDTLTHGPQIIIGSSMGGWIGLLLARARPERLAGYIGISAAPDFTHDIVIPSLSPAQKEELERNGKIYEEVSPPDHVEVMTKKLIEDGAKNLVLRAPLEINAPVRLFQGMKDRQVPWRTALKIAGTITNENVRVTLVKDGDHRLSRPDDLALLWHGVDGLLNG